VAIGVEKPYHHGNLRAALLERAERTLSDEGAPELSLRGLARDIGVSHAAPRRHFADKQALLDALAEDGFERLGTDLTAAIENAPGASFAERFTAVGRAYVRFANEHAALLDLMFAAKQRPEAEDVRAASDRTFAGPLTLVADAQARGEVVVGETHEVALVAWAVIQGFASMAREGLFDDSAIDELVGAAVERLMLGLRPRP
jgi:AcrR family transcriptional regulator